MHNALLIVGPHVNNRPKQYCGAVSATYRASAVLTERSFTFAHALSIAVRPLPRESRVSPTRRLSNNVMMCVLNVLILTSFALTCAEKTYMHEPYSAG